MKAASRGRLLMAGSGSRRNAVERLFNATKPAVDRSISTLALRQERNFVRAGRRAGLTEEPKLMGRMMDFSVDLTARLMNAYPSEDTVSASRRMVARRQQIACAGNHHVESRVPCKRTGDVMRCTHATHHRGRHMCEKQHE